MAEAEDALKAIRGARKALPKNLPAGAAAALARTARRQAAGLIGHVFAHEINNALSPVAGFAELMLQQSGLTDQQRRWLKAISSSTERATGVLRELNRYRGLAATQYVESVGEKPIAAMHAFIESGRIPEQLKVQGEQREFARAGLVKTRGGRVPTKQPRRR